MKTFQQEEINPLFEWQVTPTILGIFARSSASSRANAIKGLSIGFIWHRTLHDRVDSVARGSKDSDYLVHVDFINRSMSCECPSFSHHSGACKHVIQALAKSLVIMEGGDTSASDWIGTAEVESRNATSSRKPWETHPSFDPEIAKQYDATVTTRRYARKNVDCYCFSDGTCWTGPLPVPSIGDMVTTILPTGDRLPARVIDHVEEMGFLALRVRLGETPRGYKSNEMILFGQEVVRNDTQLREARESISSEDS